ncbi:MAG TPA: YihY/virulence factor BrkB family protein [Actinomycetota bacterium]|nr:YihY/virulence factor BrkB family protein [Actinomycetota bacterium]
MTETEGGAAQRILRRADAAQRSRPALAFPVAVVKKFGDDRAGQMAALIAYYGFFSLFPLLLVFATIAAFVIQNDPALQQRLLDSALSRFPVVGPEIRANIGAIQGSSFALIVGIVLALWSGTGVVTTAQWAMDDIWDVPRAERPALPMRVLRALLMLLALAASIVLSAFLTGVDGGPGFAGAVVEILGLVGTVAISAMVFAFAYRVLTVAPVSWRDVIPGAVVAAIAWTILLLLGTWIVDRYIGRAEAVYGETFAIVIGLLAWISLFAQLFLLAAEVNVVRARRLWPRSLAASPPSAEDREVLADQAQEEQALPKERVDVRFDERSGETVDR